MERADGTRSLQRPLGNLIEVAVRDAKTQVPHDLVGRLTVLEVVALAVCRVDVPSLSASLHLQKNAAWRNARRAVTESPAEA